METKTIRKLAMAAAAALAATGAFATNVSGEPELFDMSKTDGGYVAAPVHGAAAHNLSGAGWYAGLKLTWDKNKQKASDTTTTVIDNAGAVNLSFKANSVPSGSGVANTTTSSWLQQYLATTTWYFSVTPETMYECFKAGKDYEITLTIGDNAYTATVPKDVELWEGGVKWYPAAGLLGGKVYGDAQLLADAVELGNYQDVKFLSDPSGLTFPDGFAAGDEVDGEWGVKMLHDHGWTFATVDGTNLVATCGNAGCPYNNDEVRMWLDLGTTEKDYDGLSVTRKAAFDGYFMDVFPEAAMTLTVDGVENGVMNDAGEYAVALSVTGLGDGATHVLSATVTINRKDITGAALVLSPASTTYTAAEQTVAPSVTVDGLAATFEIAEGSVTSATEIGTYSVTVDGTGNFTGTASATWEIVNTTGSLSGVAATVDDDAGTFEDGALAITNTMALGYADGVWTAGIALDWPMEKQDSLTSGHAYYATADSVKTTVSGGTVSNSEATAKFRRSALSGEKQFTYVAATVWTVPFSPAMVEAALAEGKTALEYTMRAGALAWGDSTEGDPDGVAFADYTITLPIEEPATCALGENETHDLGETLLTTTRIELAPGASVTSSVAQTAENAIFIATPGYDVVRSESGGVYTYAAVFTHEHDWSFAVVDGTNLVATCANGDCDAGGETRMWLDAGTTEKDYDGLSVTRKAAFDGFFESLFPEAAMTLTVNGVENGVMNDAGEYAVALSVTGLGDGATHVLSATVTINRKDITGAALAFAPAATLTYNAAEQTVSPSVAVDGLAATFEIAEGSTLAATEIGTYSVTVDGTGNFTGTASGTWEIVNTTGSLDVASANAGAGTVENGVLTVTDTRALGCSDGVWSAGLVLTWPVEKKGYSGIGQYGHAYYVTGESAIVTADAGAVEHETATDSYQYNLISLRSFTYLAKTVWTVELTPATIEAALAEGKTALEYTMRAGALQSETYAGGVAFADYRISIPLEGIKLYGEDGYQVYPAQSAADIVAEIKSAIDGAESLDGDGKSAAKAKVDALVEAAGGDAADVRRWIGEKTGGDYGALADSGYVVASYVLGVEKLVTDASEVSFALFEPAEGGFAVSVAIDGEDVEAARAKAAGIVRAGTDMRTFAKVDPSRISVRGGRLEIAPGAAAREFFKLLIERD